MRSPIKVFFISAVLFFSRGEARALLQGAPVVEVGVKPAHTRRADRVGNELRVIGGCPLYLVTAATDDEHSDDVQRAPLRGGLLEEKAEESPRVVADPAGLSELDQVVGVLLLHGRGEQNEIVQNSVGMGVLHVHLLSCFLKVSWRAAQENRRSGWGATLALSTTVTIHNSCNSCQVAMIATFWQLTNMNGKTQTVAMAELRISQVPERLRVAIKTRAAAESTTLNALVIELLEKSMKDWKPKLS